MHPHEPSTLTRYFGGLTEQTFQTQIGLADPPLTDYLSDLLVRFVRWDALFRVRSLAGKPLRQVAEMLFEADQRVGDARREVHRHVGDFTLFWAGVYPEALDQMQGPATRDHWLDYCAQGKRSYWIASTIDADEQEDTAADLLERLSRQFEMCAYGLREVRREWERSKDEGQGPLLFDN